MFTVILLLWITSAAAYSDQFLNALFSRTECTNIHEISQQIGFLNISETPYPSHFGYDTVIDRSKQCYILFEDHEARQSENDVIRYQLLNLNQVQAQKLNQTTYVQLIQ